MAGAFKNDSLANAFKNDSLANAFKNDNYIVINASSNEFKKFPLELCKTPEIQILYLNKNFLKKIPNNIINLINLKNFH